MTTERSVQEAGISGDRILGVDPVSGTRNESFVRRNDWILVFVVAIPCRTVCRSRIRRFRPKDPPPDLPIGSRCFLCTLVLFTEIFPVVLCVTNDRRSFERKRQHLNSSCGRRLSGRESRKRHGSHWDCFLHRIHCRSDAGCYPLQHFTQLFS